jgi:hypothetical protein
MEKLRNFLFQVIQHIDIHLSKRIDFPYSIAGFAFFYDNRAGFVIGIQNKLGEKLNFLTVFLFGFRCRIRRRSVFTCRAAMRRIIDSR